ncbi:hypothetical protein EG834_19135, partial [bacterium]|nr:hypothetical protein [bacterium]
MANKNKLALFAGLFAGLAFSITLWGYDAVTLASADAVHPWAKLLIGILPVTAFCVLIAWLSNRIDNALVSFLLWLGTGVVLCLFASHLTYDGMALYYKIFDPALAARVNYPYNSTVSTRAGVVLLVCTVLGGFAGVFFGRMIENANNALAKSAAFLPILFWSAFFISSGWTIQSFVEAPMRDPLVAIDKLVANNIQNEATPFTKDESKYMYLSAIGAATDLIHTPRQLVVARYDDLLIQFAVQIDFNGQWAE